MRKSTIGFIIMAVLTMILGIYAYVQREAAIRNEQAAVEMLHRAEARQKMAADEQQRCAEEFEQAKLRILQMEYEIEKLREQGR